MLRHQVVGQDKCVNSVLISERLQRNRYITSFIVVESINVGPSGSFKLFYIKLIAFIQFVVSVVYRCS
jgi:hypothetical protein